MEDKNRLDDIIGKKLAHFEAPYQPTSWDALQERLEVESKLAEEQFDETVQRKMSNMEVPYQSFHWLMMSSLLDEKAALKREFIRCKSAEIILLVLLLFTFGQMPRISSSFSSFEQSIIAQHTTSSSTIHPSMDSGHSPVNNSSEISENTVPPNTKTAPATTTIAREKQVAFDVLPSAAIVTLNNETPVEITAIPQIQRFYDDMQQVLPLEKQENALALLADTFGAASIQIPIINVKQHKHLRVGMFSAVNLDNIKTPYDEVFNQAPYSRLAWQYGGGFSIGWLWKRLEVETGLSYGHKAYKPILNPVYYGNINSGYKVEGIKNIELNTFQVPVNIRYSWWNKDGWQIYGLSGASIHVATQADYDVASLRASALNVRANPTTTGQSITLSQTQLDRFEREAQSSAPNSGKLKQKQFPDGWMNGGTFNENNYYTLNLGLGIERHIADGWSLFLQPTYKQHLRLMDEGIGPNLDRISTLEILFGAKVGL